jgi:hypothetical protein
VCKGIIGQAQKGLLESFGVGLFEGPVARYRLSTTAMNHIRHFGKPSEARGEHSIYGFVQVNADHIRGGWWNAIPALPHLAVKPVPM